MSSRSRIRLMELLATQGEMPVNRIVEEFQGGELEERDSTTISRNLNILKQNGFVQSRREGQSKIYWINIQQLEKVFVEFTAFLKTGQPHEDSQDTKTYTSFP